MKRYLLIAIANLFFFAHFSFGQTFKKILNTENNNTWISGKYAIQGLDGGYIIGGNAIVTENEYVRKLVLVKVNSDGDTLWTQRVENDSNLVNIVPLADGGYVFSGENSNSALIKISSSGKIVFKKNLYKEPLDNSNILPTSTGKFAIVGRKIFHSGLVLITFDNEGDTIWSKTVSSEYIYPISLQNSANGGYMILGSLGGNTVLVRTDGNGVLIWKKEYKQSFPESLTNTFDGGHAILFSEGSILKVNANGELLWKKNLYGSSNYLSAVDIKETKDYGLIAVSKEIDSFGRFNGFLHKLDKNGNKLWETKYADGNGHVELGSVVQTSDNGFIIGGTYTSNIDLGKTSLFIIKTDSDGNVQENTVHGQAYIDKNSNCKFDLGDSVLADKIIKATPGPYFEKTDKDGKYTISLPKGSFQINLLTGTELLEVACPVSGAYKASFGSDDVDTTGFDFGVKENLCYLLNINVSSNRRRRCFRNETYINYKNEGFASASNAKVYIKFPKYVIPIKADRPWTFNTTDSVYTMDIGDLIPGAFGSIKIIDSVACGDESIRNLTQCTRVWITPFNNCSLISSLWDKSKVEVNGSCVNSEYLTYSIKNSGTGDMADSSEYRMFYNYTLALKKKFKLKAGESVEVVSPSNGQTVRLEADQRPYYPYQSLPRTSIEACGRDSNGNYSVGIISSAPQDDAESEVAISCLPIIDSYDPNDKQIFPSGITANHYVKPATPLEFLIRFQNMGTDTAFNVRVVDTIALSLDISTFKITGSSHNYTYKVSGAGNAVLTFNFQNINLPDKNHDEPGSNGFVKYSITPFTDVPLNTRIPNFADIFFDYNSPVRTNTPWVIISEFTQNDPEIIRNACVTSVSSTLQPFSNVCLGEVVKLTGGKPEGGIYSGDGVENGYFNAQKVGVGTYEISYTWGRNGCSSIDTKSITVKGPPGISLNDFEAVCVNGPKVNLTGGIPKGGVFSGEGIDHNILDPLKAGLGDHEVTYTATVNGCAVSVSKIITVTVCTGAEDNALSKGLRVFPNPVKKGFVVEYKSNTNLQLTAKVYNTIGVELKSAILKEKSDGKIAAFDLENCPAGIYLLLITDGNLRETRYLVKE